MGKVTMKPLTPLMEMVLAYLSTHRAPRTATEIARGVGYSTGQERNRHAHNGRAMSPAQRVIHPLIGLRLRGLVADRARVDGLTGSAFICTDAGRALADRLAKDAT